VTTGKVEPRAGRASDSRAPSSLHRFLPATPSSFYATRGRLLVTIGVLCTFLALAAAIRHAWLPLQWDLPIQRFVEDHRTSALDTLFRTVSRFGSTLVVLAAGATLALLTWSRCRAVSIAIVVSTLARPPLEFTLKTAVGRDRPNFGQLVNGEGSSFPSGHVMAAIALYGLAPIVVGLFTRSRVVWWTSVVLSALMILAIGASRVYLGVHWFSDVVGSLLLGSFFLLGIEAVLGYAHRFVGCRAARPGTVDTTRERHSGA
jgi:undecaprenyl-diphosphatase